MPADSVRWYIFLDSKTRCVLKNQMKSSKAQRVSASEGRTLKPERRWLHSQGSVTRNKLPCSPYRLTPVPGRRKETRHRGSFLSICLDYKQSLSEKSWHVNYLHLIQYGYICVSEERFKVIKVF